MFILIFRALVASSRTEGKSAQLFPEQQASQFITEALITQTYHTLLLPHLHVQSHVTTHKMAKTL